MFKRFKKTTIIAAVLATGLAGAAIAQQKTMAIGTGGTGGVYYPLGGAIANVLSKTLPNTQATAEVTGGSVDNLKLIASGQSEMGFSMADAAFDAFKGEDKFKSGKVPLRTLLVVYPNRMHVVTVEGTGIEKFTDLKGKRVSTGSPGSATEVMAFRVIEAGGLDKDKDLKRERLGVAESVNALKDRKIDAFFYVVGHPSANIQDPMTTCGAQLVNVTGPAIANLVKANAFYADATIPAKTYPSQATDLNTYGVLATVVTSAKKSDEEVYLFTKAVFDNLDEFKKLHPAFAGLTPEKMIQAGLAAPLHPGAVKYYKEKGWVK
jgi:TRAP transporter TAXI family solute receptor